MTMQRRKPFLVDPACRELARHFLSDLAGAEHTHVCDLAEIFQHCADAYCTAFEQIMAGETGSQTVESHTPLGFK